MAKAKKESAMSVADMKKAIWERGFACCSPWEQGFEVIHSNLRTPGMSRIGSGATPDEAWRNAYDALFGGKG